MLQNSKQYNLSEDTSARNTVLLLKCLKQKSIENTKSKEKKKSVTYHWSFKKKKTTILVCYY